MLLANDRYRLPNCDTNQITYIEDLFLLAVWRSQLLSYTVYLHLHTHGKTLCGELFFFTFLQTKQRNKYCQSYYSDWESVSYSLEESEIFQFTNKTVSPQISVSRLCLYAVTL